MTHLLLYSGLLAVSLGVVIAACELFTNGVEWAGKRLDLSHGATGSLLAAVGTALPETMVPVVALMSGRGGTDVAVGAIAGSPFMLATVAMFVTGAAYLTARAAGRTAKFNPDAGALVRDLGFFAGIYGTAIAATFIPAGLPRYVVAAGLVAAYLYYARVTLAHEGDSDGDIDGLILARLTGAAPNAGLIAAQVFAGLCLIAAGAHFFVLSVKEVSAMAGIPAVILALFVSPVATELPEMLNSVKWVRTGKDTLAMGNVTGALVFQASFPVAIGVAFTPWELDGPTMVSALIALCMAVMLLVAVKGGRRVPAGVLLVGGAAYLFFVGYVLAG